MYKVLCDYCHREYETDDEDILSDRNFNIERICPDCECDMAESESLKQEYTH